MTSLGEETSWTEKSSGCTDLGASGGGIAEGGGVGGGGWRNKDITLRERQRDGSFVWNDLSPQYRSVFTASRQRQI